jgi:hemerythrin-like domain-containing protein
MKRHESLQPLSREHHHGLLLCWKIKTGISKGIEISRIKKYADWFYQNHILPHFDEEENHVFPLLGGEHHMVKKALTQHASLRELFTAQSDIQLNLQRICEELDKHIRFEERELFPKIQEDISEEALRTLNEVHNETAFYENTEDMFWA